MTNRWIYLWYAGRVFFVIPKYTWKIKWQLRNSNPQPLSLQTNTQPLSVSVWNKWLLVRIPLLSLKLQIWCQFRARNSLTFRQTVECRSTLKLVCDMIITYRWIYLSLSIKFFTDESCSPIPVRWFCVRSAKEAMCKKNTIYVAVIGTVFQGKVDLSLGEASE